MDRIGEQQIVGIGLGIGLGIELLPESLAALAASFGGEHVNASLGVRL